MVAAPAHAANPRPRTIPALRIWKGGNGTTRIKRIVVPYRYRRALTTTAGVFAADLRRLTGHRVRVVRRRHVRARRGDVKLLLRSHDRRLGSEGYRLVVGRRAISIRARRRGGVFYGTRTLLQLVRQSHSLPRGRAIDWPRYPERGLMIDLGRRRYAPAWIEDRIRELAYLKLNLLHLHLTDDERWGVASSTHPEIVSPGALTKAELRRIVRLAARYRVTVVPEIDMPGHLGSVLKQHPGLGLKTALGTAAGGGKLDITNPAALRLVTELIQEYLPLFPGRYWHVGADEYLMPAQYALYPQLAAYARRQYGPRANTNDAILGFVNHIDSLVRAYGKTTRAWHDELGHGGVLKANPDIVVEWWVNISPLSDLQPPTPQELLADGHRVLNAGWFPTYFTEDLGPIDGKPDPAEAYDRWSVDRFFGPEIAGVVQQPPYLVAPGEPRNLGSVLNAWNNAELTDAQIETAIAPRLRVIAQKTWESPQLAASYAGFQNVAHVVGSAP